MIVVRTVVLFFILTSLSLYVHGFEVPRFRRVSVEQGLSSNFVRSIYQDRDGFVWIGTLESLDRYDGYEIRPYAHSFPGQAESVTAIVEDNDNNLWLGTENGLFWFDRSSEKFHFVELSAGTPEVNSLQALHNGQIIAGTNNGIFVYHPKTAKADHISFHETLNHDLNRVSSMVTDGDDRVWISTMAGLVLLQLSGYSYTVFRFEENNQSGLNNFSGITRLGDHLFLGTHSRGLVRFNTQNSEFYKYPFIGSDLILCLHSDQKNNLYVGTDGGGLKIVHLDTETITHIERDANNPLSINSNTVYSFMLDEQGRYWLGTYTGGLNFSMPPTRHFDVFTNVKAPRLSTTSIRSFLNNDKWGWIIGTRNGLWHLPSEGAEPVHYLAGSQDAINNLRSNIVLAVYEYMGTPLIGTYGGGISVFNPASGGFHAFPAGDPFETGFIYGFEKDKYNNLWIASLDGLYKYNPITTELNHYHRGNSQLENNELFSVKIDSRGRLWIGSMRGVQVFEITSGGIKSLDIDQALTGMKVNTIIEDLSGNIWIGTERAGLFKITLDFDGLVNFTETDGLPNNNICGIVEYNEDIWISTLRGLSWFHPEHGRFRNFFLSDGLPSLLFNPCAADLSDNGLLWFGSESGLLFFDPIEILEQDIPTNLKITDFYLFGNRVVPAEDAPIKKNIESVTQITLNGFQNSIGFRFVALNFINPFENQYAVMLEGYDQDWQALGNLNEIHYDHLPPGDYIFKVKSGNSFGDESAQSYEAIQIRIKPVFYKTPWFIAAFLVMALLLALYIVLYIRRLYKYKLRYGRRVRNNEEKLPHEQSEEIIEKLLDYMEKEKPYLNEDLKLSDLSEATGFSVHKISWVLNTRLNKSFSDFINNYRIGEVKSRLQDEDPAKYTLTAIAEQCGFKSKTSFYRLFKKETGLTPAQYLKQILSGTDT